MKSILMPAAFAACASVGGFVYHWSSGQAASDAGRNAEPEPVAVHVVQAEQRDVNDRIELVGTLDAAARVEIRSRVRGYVLSLPFDIGDEVELKEGEERPVVVEIDDILGRTALQEAEAALDVAKAQRKARQSECDASKRLIDRHRTLIENNAVSKLKIDELTSAHAIATAAVELEESRVSQAEVDVDRFRSQLDLARIHAPFRGLVADRYVEVGDLANPDDPLLSMIDVSTVKTIVYVGEGNYERIVVDQLAEIHVAAFPGKPFEGRVARKSPVLDLDTRQAAVQIEIDNPHGLLKPGMHANVSLIADERETVTVVPMSAVLEHTHPPRVFIVTGEPPRVVQRDITIGAREGETVEIKAGISQGDWVVTLGSHMVFDGQLVEAQRVGSEGP